MESTDLSLSLVAAVGETEAVATALILSKNQQKRLLKQAKW